MLKDLPINIVYYKSTRLLYSVLSAPNIMRRTTGKLNADVVHTHVSFAVVYSRLEEYLSLSRLVYVRCANG